MKNDVYDYWKQARFLTCKLSDRHPIHLQWVPSHVGLASNVEVDDLAKAATSDPVDPEDQHGPGSAISFKGSTSYQTAFTRFSTDHLRCMNFEGDKRSFSICTKCNISPISPQYILQCLGLSCEEAVASPFCS
ncbi:RNase H domain-containing protein [Trichonephila clavipes]|nr:RNase H domain-containing protein [Trichonephila clavipes]